MVDPEKWAEGIERRREQTANREAQEEAAFIARREIFNEQAPRLWPKVRETFEAFCEAYNKKRDVFSCATIGVDDFIVRRKDLPNIVCTVSRVSGHKIHVQSPAGNEVYEPRAFQNGHGSVQYVCSSDRPITPDEIAAAVLGPIAGI
jgi:hypothetical protein